MADFKLELGKTGATSSVAEISDDEIAKLRLIGPVAIVPPDQVDQNRATPQQNSGTLSDAFLTGAKATSESFFSANTLKALGISLLVPAAGCIVGGGAGALVGALAGGIGAVPGAGAGCVEGAKDASAIMAIIGAVGIAKNGAEAGYSTYKVLTTEGKEQEVWSRQLGEEVSQLLVSGGMRLIGVKVGKVVGNISVRFKNNQLDMIYVNGLTKAGYPNYVIVSFNLVGRNKKGDLVFSGVENKIGSIQLANDGDRAPSVFPSLLRFPPDAPVNHPKIVRLPNPAPEFGVNPLLQIAPKPTASAKVDVKLPVLVKAGSNAQSVQHRKPVALQSADNIEKSAQKPAGEPPVVAKETRVVDAINNLPSEARDKFLEAIALALQIDKSKVPSEIEGLVTSNRLGLYYKRSGINGAPPTVELIFDIDGRSAIELYDNVFKNDYGRTIRELRITAKDGHRLEKKDEDGYPTAYYKQKLELNAKGSSAPTELLSPEKVLEEIAKRPPPKYFEPIKSFDASAVNLRLQRTLDALAARGIALKVREDVPTRLEEEVSNVRSPILAGQLRNAFPMLRVYEVDSEHSTFVVPAGKEGHRAIDSSLFPGFIETAKKLGSKVSFDISVILDKFTISYYGMERGIVLDPRQDMGVVEHELTHLRTVKEIFSRYYTPGREPDIITQANEFRSKIFMSRHDDEKAEAKTNILMKDLLESVRVASSGEDLLELVAIKAQKRFYLDKNPQFQKFLEGDGAQLRNRVHQWVEENKTGRRSDMELWALRKYISTEAYEQFHKVKALSGNLFSTIVNEEELSAARGRYQLLTGLRDSINIKIPPLYEIPGH